MKLSNEKAMYIVLYVSLSFQETSSLYDENDYFDSDLVPFLSINKNLSQVSPGSENTNEFTYTSAQTSYSVGNLQFHNNASVATLAIGHHLSTQNNQGIFSTNVSNEYTTSHDMIEYNVTDNTKCGRGNESANIIPTKNYDFLDKNVSEQFLSRNYSSKPAYAENIFIKGILKRNNEDFANYTFSNFFESLLSLLSFLNPDLLNVLRGNIKEFQGYNPMKRDCMSYNTAPSRYPVSSSTLKTMICNCDYCRTGAPDTVLYIVSGKKSNNSVTYHKLTSINRSKLKTSYRYQLQTPDDNDSNRSLQSFHLPVKYDKQTFGNDFDNAVNEKIINRNAMTNDIRNELSMMLPVSRENGAKLMSGYNSIKSIDQPSNENKNEPKIFKVDSKKYMYESPFYFGNQPLVMHSDWNNNEDNLYKEKNYSNKSFELMSYLRESVIKHSKEYKQHRHNDYAMSENGSSNGEGNNVPTLGKSLRTINNLDMNRNSTVSLNRIAEIRNENSPGSFLIPDENFIGTEKPGVDEGYLTTNTDYNKNTLDAEIATAGEIPLLLPPESKTILDVTLNINKDHEHKRVTHEINAVGSEKITPTEHLEKSIMYIFNKLMSNTENEIPAGTKFIEAATIPNNILTSTYINNIDDPTSHFTNGSPLYHITHLGSSTVPIKETDLSYKTVLPTLAAKIVTSTTILNNSLNKKET